MTRFRVTALPGGGGACRVDIELARPWKYTPGSHAYVYLPWVSLWQSHPFSVAWSNTPSQNSDSHALEARKGRCISYDSEYSNDTYSQSLADDDMHGMEKMKAVNRNLASRLHIHLPHNQDPEDIPWSDRNTISMVISKRSGMTGALWEMANRAQSKTIYLRGFLEGEYGAQHGLYSYGMVVLIAGGVGITHCLGWARELLHLYREGRGVARRVVLVWVIPEKEQYEWCRNWFDEIFNVPGWEEVCWPRIHVLFEIKHPNFPIVSYNSTLYFSAQGK